MKRQSKLESILAQVRGNRKTRRITSVLAFLVVFVTLWRLTLPAITLEWGKPQAEGITEPEAAEETLQEEELLAEETLSDEVSEEEEPLLRWATLKEAEEAGYPDAVRVDRLICGQTESDEHTHSEDCIESYYTAQTASFAEEAFLAMPAQRFEGEAGSLSVRVDAAEGTFPEETEMALTEADAAEVRRAAAGLLNRKIGKVIAVDIGFLYEGEKIEPEQAVQVALFGSALKELKNPVLIHIDGEGNAEIVDCRIAEEPSPAPRLRMAARSVQPEETLTETTDETAENTEGLTEETLSEEAPEETIAEESLTDREELPKGALVFEAKDFSVYAVVTTIETTYITADGETYGIKVTCGEDAGIPEGAALAVRELSEEEYADYRAKTAEALGCRENAIGYLKLLDISIVKDGEPIQPQAKVDVEIRLLDKTQSGEKEETGRVVHFGEEAEELACTAETVKETPAVTFQTDAFSVYAVTYTVDFHYEVDGKVFEFSLPGGGFLSFKELMTALEIAKDDPETEENELDAFLADVQDVAFSSPELVSVSKVEEDTTVGAVKDALGLACEYSAELTEEDIEKINAAAVSAGDWALISLKPFDTEESLTVTMANGEVFTVKVTDAQIKQTVISASGETYEIIVTYEKDAGIPNGAELNVREILPEDEAYKALQEKAREELTDEINDAIPKRPVFFDISIVFNGEKIEPAAGSSLQVEMKLLKGSVPGFYTEENSPFLLNDAPLSPEDQEIQQKLLVIHDVKDGKLDVVDIQEKEDEACMIGEFSTDSFSNWLVFLDEEVDEITIGRGDTITLRPYSQWVWDQQNVVDGQSVSWVQPDPQGHMTWERKHYEDGQLNQEYYYYQLTATANPGDFYIETTAGKRIHVIVKGEEVSGTPDTVAGLDTIKVNLFNYDKDKSLDVEANVASWIDAENDQYKKFEWNQWGQQVTTTQQGPYANDGINAGSALKFLGWGASNGGNRINNYTSTSVTTGIVSDTLQQGTDRKKYPKLEGNGNTNLQYLFSPGNSDVEAHMGVTGLFRQDEDGYYYFNSNTNYAIYNNDNTFTLYEHTYTQATTRNNTTGQDENSKPIGFFPFHPYDSNNDLSPNHDTDLDHHFGISMEVKFVLPPDKKLHRQDGTADDIVFEFSGDDDMWVFVDDNLALDMGGIHQPLTGNINFTNDSRFQGGQEYTLRIFYLERGGCDSNCSIRFNIPLTKRRIEFEKQDEEDKTVFVKDARFGLFKDAECTIPAVDDTTGDIYTATSDDNGKVSFPSVSIGTYYMKELEAPAGYRLDTTVRTVKLTENGVTIDGDADASRNGIQIANKKNPDLTVEKIWQNQLGQPADPPSGASAKFKLQRYERHEGDTVVPDTSQPCTFRVYRYRENSTPVQVGSDYTFKGGTDVSVNWGYSNGYYNNNYSGIMHYKLDTSESYRNKTDPVTVHLPESGVQNIYIRDENVATQWGAGVVNVTVSGTPYAPSDTQQYVSTDWAPDTEYNNDQNTPTLTFPENDEDPWKGIFENLLVIEEKDGLTYHYQYYVIETETTPSGAVIIYQDGNGNPVQNPSDLKTDNSATEKVVNRITQYDVVVEKVDAANNSIKLGGAVFDLYGEDAVDEHGKIKTDAAALAKNLISSSDPSEKGKVSLGTLMVGEYYLVEKTAPSGYLLLDMPIHISITENNRVSLMQGTTIQQTAVITAGTTEATLKVVNSAGAALPSTGGPGTRAITLAGLALTLLALAGIAEKRKHR